MSRAKLATKVKAKDKKTKLSKAGVKALNDKYYGTEPIDISVKGFGEALNWYNYMFTADETRPWLFEYMKKNGYHKDDIAAIRRVPKYKITNTTCSTARIIMNGNVLSEKSMVYFRNGIQTLIDLGKTIKEKVVEEASDKSAPTIQDRLAAKIKQLITECEEAVDTDDQFNVYDWLMGKEATPAAAIAIGEYYSNFVSDLSYVDEFETRSEKKSREAKLNYWQQFVADCERYAGNKKAAKVRKPREKKQASAVDLVKKLKFQKEFPALKIVSINPAEIIGAQQLWVYNTKYKKVTKYLAVGPAGLQVKGTSITGYDVEQSSTKGLRKPEVFIQQLLKAGKVWLRTALNDLKTKESKPNGRINSDTILLRVIR